MLPSFLEDLLQSEDLVRGAATRPKNRCGHPLVLIPPFLGISFQANWLIHRWAS